jgi:TPR repeat protein
VPIYDYAEANRGVVEIMNMEDYYPCCGKSVCAGCMFSFNKADNDKCPFCNSDRAGKTLEEIVEDLMKRAEANDAASIGVLANYYEHGNGGLQQDHAKAIELYTRTAELGCSKAHCYLGNIHHKGGDMKKAKFHFEAAAMLDTKWQDTILEAWSVTLETMNELLSIGRFRRQLGAIFLCII